MNVVPPSLAQAAPEHKEEHMIAGHGVNIGHGYTKYIIIDGSGQELGAVVFPAMIAPARRSVGGSIARASAVRAGGSEWWVGEDALLSSGVLTSLTQERLEDASYIPALAKSAVSRFGELDGAAAGYCVTGLPATWAASSARALSLGARLREAYPFYTSIRVIPEPLGLVYSALLDNDGEIVGDTALQTGHVAVVDIGFHTVDVATIRRLVPAPAGLDTYTLGTARPLSQIRARLSAHFERELSLYEVDQAAQTGRLTVAGVSRSLPLGWDRPLLAHADALASRLGEAWQSGSQFDAILVGGGGASLTPLVAAIQARFRHARAVESPQLAIARGYARLARRLAGEGQGGAG
jgi:hypothetical protein